MLARAGRIHLVHGLLDRLLIGRTGDHHQPAARRVDRDLGRRHKLFQPGGQLGTRRLFQRIDLQHGRVGARLVGLELLERLANQPMLRDRGHRDDASRGRIGRKFRPGDQGCEQLGQGLRIGFAEPIDLDDSSRFERTALP